MSALVTMTAKKIESERRRSRSVEKPKKINVIKRNKAMVAIVVVVILMIVSVAVIYLLPGKNNNVVGGNRFAVIDTTMGTIKVELYEDKAPITTANFIKLANDGFYDGLVFHRVIDNFMIQSGGFSSDGIQKTDPYGPITLETSSDLKHDDGAISMARQGQDMTDSTYFNTATSQFFICDGPQHSLDNYYAVFGKVTDGMDIVRAIAALDPDHTTTKYGMQNWPVTDVTINSITITTQ